MADSQRFHTLLKTIASPPLRQWLTHATLTLADTTLAHGLQADAVAVLQDPSGAAVVLANAEHQSTYDPEMAYRLGIYGLLAARRHSRNHPRGPRPAVLGFVVAHGKTPWPTHAEATHLAPRWTHAHPGFGALDMALHVLDLTQRPPFGASSAVIDDQVRVVLNVLQRGRDAPVKALRDASPATLHHLSAADSALQEEIARYVVEQGDQDVAEDELHYLQQHAARVGEGIMSWGQRLRAEGEQQGLEQGLEQGREQGLLHALIRLGARRFGTPSDSVRARLQAADAPRLEALMDRLLDADGWHDLLRP